MKRLILLLSIITQMPIAGWCVDYSAVIKITGKPSTQWLVISDGQVLKRVSAEREEQEGAVKVVAALSQVSTETMGSFVVMTEDGTIFSTPFTSLKVNELEQESIHLAEVQVPILRELLEQERAKLEAKKGELSLVNLKKRKEFGFDEVDKIYERIAILMDEKRRVLNQSESH